MGEVLSRRRHQVNFDAGAARQSGDADRRASGLDLTQVLGVDLIHLGKAIRAVMDPGHGTGYWEYVAPMAKASVACGADGLIIEVHPNPAEAQSDGLQSLKPQKFQQLMDELRPVAEAVGRRL